MISPIVRACLIIQQILTLRKFVIFFSSSGLAEGVRWGVHEVSELVLMMDGGSVVGRDSLGLAKGMRGCTN